VFLIPLLRFLPYIFAALAALSAIAWVKHKVTHWCNTVCVEQTERAETAEKLLEAARKRATELALLWAAQVDKTEAKNREADAERRKAFDALADRARHLPGLPSVRLGVDADRVWRDSSREANAARPPAEREAVPDSVPQPAYSEQDLATFFVESARAYADAYGQWQACVNHYESLRTAE
jgi:hypothetical protein